VVADRVKKLGLLFQVHRVTKAIKASLEELVLQVVVD